MITYFKDIVNHVLEGVTTYEVTLKFGPCEPFKVGTTIVSSHNGVDIRNIARIIAPARGKVIAFRNDVKASQTPDIILNKRTSLYSGNYIELQHGGGLHSVYKHLAEGSIPVKVGDVVEKKAVTGKAGATGFLTGLHTHVEFILNGVRVDPLPYLLGKKPILPYVEAVITEKPRQSVLIASASQLNYRKDPNEDAIAYLKPGEEYPLLGITNEVNGWRWAQIVVDNAIVYSALNPSWNKIVDPAPVEVIKEVPMQFSRTFDVDGLDLIVAMKARVK